MKTLNIEVSVKKHNLMYKETLNASGRKVRVLIKSAAYKFDSDAIVELFDGNRWNQLDSIGYCNMKTPESLYYRANREKVELSKQGHHFKEDRDELIKLAKDVLEG